MDKIFATDETNERLISKIYKQLLQLNIKQTDKQFCPFSIVYLSRHYSEENMQMADRHMKRCSAPPLEKCKSKLFSMRYHLTQVRMTIIKKIYK